MRKLYLLTALLLAAATMTGSAPKRGAFNAESPRTGLPTAQQATPTQANRSIVVDPVLPRSFGQARQLADATNPPFTASQRPGQAGAPARVLGDGTTIYGSLIFSTAWPEGTVKYGIYSFPASTYQAPTMVYDQDYYGASGGGCYADGVYYWNDFVYTEEMGYTFSTFCTYNFATKEFTKNIHSFINEGFDQSQITNCMTYDKSTGRIFALSYVAVTEEDGYIRKFYPALSEVDSYSGIVSPISQIPAMVAIACTPAGELYGITGGNNSRLYRINKNSADLTEIGATGLDTKFAQSMAFDPVTGKLYWAAVESNGNSGLYEVDTATGAAQLIFRFNNHEEYTGLYIPEPSVSAGAPAAITDLAADFAGGALSGTVSFTAPATTYSGAQLTGELDVTLSVDGKTEYEGKLNAGQSHSVNITLSEGIHSFSVLARNAAGEGPRTAKAAYVGIDAPAEVANLTLEKSGNSGARISWEAPTTGRNDGYVDPSQLTYTVKRYPGGTTVASNISATFFNDPVNAQADNYHYGVTAYCGGRQGIETFTESGIFGTGTDLPCHFSLATEDDYKLFTVIDANQDWEAEYSWGGWMYGDNFKYTKEEDGKCAIYGYHPENAADDWLITPPVAVEKGKKYIVKFNMWTRGDKETLEITAGPGNAIADQTPIIAAKEYNHTDHREFVQEFTAKETGNYYIGFHITSPKKRFYLCVGDIMVDAVPDNDAPAAVAGLTVTPDANGADKALVSFTAPTTSADGSALKSIDRIDVYYGVEQTPIHTFTAPKPGQALSYTDNPANGWVSYRVVATAAGKAGAKAEARVFVGWDIPLAVTDLAVSDAGGRPTVSWTAPTQGENGGYINPSELTYMVFRYEDNAVLVGRDVKGTTFTDNDPALDDGEQHQLAYLVFPVGKATIGDPAGAGETNATDYIIYGEPYDVPFVETFADASVHANVWSVYRLRGNQQNWGVAATGSNPTCYDVGNDGGLAVYSAGGRVGDEGLLVSPKYNLSTLNNPQLSFWFFHNYTQEHEAWGEPFEDRLIPEVMLPDGSRTALGDAILVDDLGNGWLEYKYLLTDYIDQPYIRIAFHGITACEQDVYIDHVSVTNRIGNDLQAYTFSGPASVRAGESATYRMTVRNGGADPVEEGVYNICLYNGGELLETLPGKAMESRAYETYAFTRNFAKEDEGKTFYFHAEIEWADDETPDNNISTPVTTRIAAPVLPEVHELKADLELNNVNFTWGTPDAIHTEDSFEDYTPFGIDDFAGYRMIDGDGNDTYGFQDIYFDNTGEPQAFMVFDPYALGIVMPGSSLFPYDSYDPRTGRQVLACIQGYKVGTNGYAQTAANDDWFILPQLFDAQTVSFYAKSGDYMQGTDKFEVMYSTTDRTPASFKQLVPVTETGKDWTLCEFELPQGTRYIAIHCVSEDGFVMMIDDLKFTEYHPESLLKLEGYRLYRNGSAIADLPAATMNYTDFGLADGTYRYWMTALYEGGRESGKTGEVTLTIGQGSVDGLEADGVKVHVEEGTILVDCDKATAVKASTASGILLYNGEAARSHEIIGAQGVTILTIGGTSYKINVK